MVQQIKAAIFAGRYGAGDRLPNERELCGLFGVSRGTLREGLRTLEAVGLVEIRPGAAGGIFVVEPQGDQVGTALDALLRFRRVTARELAEFRVSFESENARWAARRADDGQIQELKDLAHEFISLSRVEDTPWADLTAIDVAFHEALALGSQNQVRVAIMLGIHSALAQAEASIANLAAPNLRQAIGKELLQIANAVASRNEDRAATLTRKHVKKFADLESDVEQGQE